MRTASKLVYPSSSSSSSSSLSHLPPSSSALTSLGASASGLQQFIFDPESANKNEVKSAGTKVKSTAGTKTKVKSAAGTKTEVKGAAGTNAKAKVKSGTAGTSVVKSEAIKVKSAAGTRTTANGPSTARTIKRKADGRDHDVAQRPNADDGLRNEEDDYEEEDGLVNEGAGLSASQAEALRHVMAGQSTLILGGGGTGKSYLIEYLVGKLRAQKKTVAVTAMTGLAAFNIGGSTVHSFAGIGLGTCPVDALIKKVRSRPNSRRNWVDTDVLVIDEISMMSKELFDVLDTVGRVVRRCTDEPWGGLQVIGVGDFGQLPPVRADYCFDSPMFPHVFSHRSTVQLTTNFRQNEDPALRGILAEIRQGKLSPQSIAILTACTTKVVPPNLGIDPTYIAATRRQVDGENQTRMAALPGEERRYRHVFLPPRGMPAAAAETLHQSMLRGVPCADELVLKVGAQVMYLCNSSAINKHNGSMGIVRSFRHFGRGPGTQGGVQGGVQGGAQGGAQGAGQGGAAGGIGSGIGSGLGGGSGSGLFNPLPVVEFSDGTTHVIDVHDWRTPDNKATFRQIPLILAFALTIHKIQGATLDYARIDAGRSLFEANQMYVALSRLRSIKGLYLTEFDPSRVLVHEAAVRFYVDLQEAQQLDKQVDKDQHKDKQVDKDQGKDNDQGKEPDGDTAQYNSQEQRAQDQRAQDQRAQGKQEENVKQEE